MIELLGHTPLEEDGDFYKMPQPKTRIFPNPLTGLPIEVTVIQREFAESLVENPEDVGVDQNISF